jgi:hypothetical protein
MGKELFSYRITKNGKLFVYWHGSNGIREIVFKGAPAEKLTSSGATSARSASSGPAKTCSMEVVASPLVVEWSRCTKK